MNFTLHCENVSNEKAGRSICIGLSMVRCWYIEGKKIPVR